MPKLKNFLPHIYAWLIMLAFSIFYFKPVVFEGYTLQQGDILRAGGMQGEVKKMQEETGVYPLWTNAMFAGMPTYQIRYTSKSLLKPLFRAGVLGNRQGAPHTAALLLMTGFYFLLVVMKVDWRLAVAGAIGFGLSANAIDLIEAGHATKVMTIAYLAPTLAGIVLTYRGKYWLGAGITALFMGLQIYSNHVQITYYFGLSLLVFGILYLVDALKNGTMPHFIKASLFTVAAMLLGVASNTGKLWTTYEYSQETIRGKSELTQKAAGASGSTAGEGGLSKSYAFGWSYGILETYNLLIPNYVGGSSVESFASDPNSATIKELRKLPDSQQAMAMAQQTTHYWGSQPFTMGGVYLGSIIILAFFLGCFLVKSPFKWYAVIAAVMAIMFAWGDSFKAFNYFVFDYFPLYNKFRAVTMALSITNFFTVLLAILGLKEFFDKNLSEAERKSALVKAGAITGGLVLLGLLLSFGLDYAKDGENLPAAVAAAVAEDRAALLQADVGRTFLFVALGFGLLWAWMKFRFNAVLAVIGIGLFSLIDIWGIGTRFIGEEDYIPKNQLEGIKEASDVDKQILADPDPHYRVADFRRNPFSDAMASYHHKSIGGYHAAKLMRYQELIEKYLGDPAGNGPIYGMLNAKYFINQSGQVIRNPDALGNAWFVKSLETVPDADAEYNALADLDPRNNAIASEKYIGDLKGFQPQFDSTATIRLTSYHPDEMVYSYSAKSDQLAVFSEVYYPPSKGWKMFIDGQPAPDFTKVNFLLRAAKLPAGQHEVKMVFAPKSYYTGETISLVASLLAVIILGYGIFWFNKNYQWPSPANLPKADIKEKESSVRKAKPTKSKKRK